MHLGNRQNVSTLVSVDLNSLLTVQSDLFELNYKQIELLGSMQSTKLQSVRHVNWFSCLPEAGGGACFLMSCPTLPVLGSCLCRGLARFHLPHGISIATTDLVSCCLSLCLHMGHGSRVAEYWDTLTIFCNSVSGEQD